MSPIFQWLIVGAVIGMCVAAIIHASVRKTPTPGWSCFLYLSISGNSMTAEHFTAVKAILNANGAKCVSRGQELLVEFREATPSQYEGIKNLLAEIEASNSRKNALRSGPILAANGKNGAPR